MAMEFFKATTLCVIDFRYEGHPRRWFKAFGADVDLHAEAIRLLRDLYGARVQLVEARKATAQEELQYLRGEEAINVLCPTGRHP
jgi:uncharacterized DUF497 family protein